MGAVVSRWSLVVGKVKCLRKTPTGDQRL